MLEWDGCLGAAGSGAGGWEEWCGNDGGGGHEFAESGRGGVCEAVWGFAGGVQGPVDGYRSYGEFGAPEGFVCGCEGAEGCGGDTDGVWVCLFLVSVGERRVVEVG